jgi:hypothetical protein
MITINLLPPEFRVEEHASPTRMLVIAASILLGLIGCGFYLFVHFYQLENVIQALEKDKKRRESLRTDEQTFATLTSLKASFETRDKTVEAVRALRVPLSQKIHEFAELVHQGNHPVWLGNLSIAPKRATGADQQKRGAAQTTAGTPTYEWTGGATCASDSLKAAIKFYNAIKEDKKFYQDFLDTEVPRYTQQKITGDYVQKISWKFNLKMAMKMAEKKPEPTPPSPGK